jgi:hypothetical protein
MVLDMSCIMGCFMSIIGLYTLVWIFGFIIILDLDLDFEFWFLIWPGMFPIGKAGNDPICFKKDWIYFAL